MLRTSLDAKTTCWLVSAIFALISVFSIAWAAGVYSPAYADMEIEQPPAADFEPSRPEIEQPPPADLEESDPSTDEDPTADFEPSQPEIEQPSSDDLEPSEPEVENPDE